jgi:hypothetical protein
MAGSIRRTSTVSSPPIRPTPTLKLGELWAIPIMLRLALIENLRRVAARIAASRTDQNLADGWADRMLAMAERDPKNLILVIADMARSNPRCPAPSWRNWRADSKARAPHWPCR